MAHLPASLDATLLRLGGESKHAIGARASDEDARKLHAGVPNGEQRNRGECCRRLCAERRGDAIHADDATWGDGKGCALPLGEQPRGGCIGRGDPRRCNHEGDAAAQRLENFDLNEDLGEADVQACHMDFPSAIGDDFGETDRLGDTCVAPPAVFTVHASSIHGYCADLQAFATLQSAMSAR